MYHRTEAELRCEKEACAPWLGQILLSRGEQLQLRLLRLGERYPDALLSVFPKPENVMGAFARFFGSSGVKGGPAHLHGG